jgi:hypothetical protein
MKRNVVACAVAAVMLAACESAPGADKVMDPSALRWNSDAIVYTESVRDVPWSSTDTHPCNTGESIAVEGTSHWVIHTGFDDLGGFHYKVNIVSKGTGLGAPSGKSYKISEHYKDTENVPGNYTSYIVYETMRLKVDGPTTGDDYYKTTIVKIVVNAQGVETIGVDSQTTSCS